MSKLLSVVITAFVIVNSINAQYISNVSVPDAIAPRLTDEKINPSIRYANSISPVKLREYMKVLASDSLEGRETGQQGIKYAEDFITKHISNLGLSAPLPYRSYKQPVAFTYFKWADTDIFLNGERYRHLYDYLAFPDKNNSVPVIASQEVVFLGYGIETDKYNDYKKQDVKGKVILINRGEPYDKKGKSYITKTTEASKWSDDDMAMKLKVAREKGVALVIIIENDIKKILGENRNQLLGFKLNLGNLKDSILPYPNHVHVSTTLAKAIIGEKEKDIIKAREKMAKGKNRAVNLPADFAINMTKKATLLEGNNILGVIDGKSKKDEYVIVSAHYDHLGKKGDEVFNGADDNGSGSATLMELSRVLQQAVLEGKRPERSVVFLWFCGEEKGLLGSEYYAEHPVFPLTQTIVNVNVDMVGRVDDKYKSNKDYLYVIGSDRLSTDLHKVNEDINNKFSKLTLDYTYNDEADPNRYYYRSDHYNFAKKGIPAIFFFNGVHKDYHMTTDDIDKIEFDTMAKRGSHIFHLLWELANRPDKINVDGVIK